MLPQPNAVPM
jgi:hypothetical protein